MSSRPECLSFILLSRGSGVPTERDLLLSAAVSLAMAKESVAERTALEVEVVDDGEEAVGVLIILFLA